VRESTKQYSMYGTAVRQLFSVRCKARMYSPILTTVWTLQSGYVLICAVFLTRDKAT